MTMSRLTGCFVTFFVIVFCFFHLAAAQVTFSKGWGPGKRAALYDDDCRLNSKTLTLMFHTMMAEMKRLMARDHQAVVNYLQSIEH